MQARDIEELAQDGFWRWMASMHARGAEMRTPRDLILTPACVTQFALQIDPDGELSFGSTMETMDALASVPWTGAVLYRSAKGKGPSYVGLQASDINGEGADGDDPCEIRVSFPIDGVKVEAFVGAPTMPSRLRLRPLRIRKGQPVFATGDARQEVELKMSGFGKPGAKAA